MTSEAKTKAAPVKFIIANHAGWGTGTCLWATQAGVQAPLGCEQSQGVFFQNVYTCLGDLEGTVFLPGFCTFLTAQKWKMTVGLSSLKSAGLS